MAELTHALHSICNQFTKNVVFAVGSEPERQLAFKELILNSYEFCH